MGYSCRQGMASEKRRASPKITVTGGPGRFASQAPVAPITSPSCSDGCTSWIMAQSRLLPNSEENKDQAEGREVRAGHWPRLTQAELDQNDLPAKGLAPETPSYSSFQLPKGFPSAQSGPATSPPHPSCFPLALGVEHPYTGSGITHLLQTWPVGQDTYVLS